MGPRSQKKVIPTKLGRPRVAHTPFSPEHRGAAQSQQYRPTPLGIWPDHRISYPGPPPPPGPSIVYKTLRLRKLRLSGKNDSLSGAPCHMGPARFNAAFTFAISSSVSNLNASRGCDAALLDNRAPTSGCCGGRRAS